jgi:hypothetical protein
MSLDYTAITIVIASLSLLLGGIGAILGGKGKIIVYYGNADYLLAWLTAIVAIVGLGFWIDDPTDPRLAIAITGTLLLVSAIIAYVANASLAKVLVAVPAKVLLVIMQAFYVIATIVLAAAAVSAVREKKVKQAVGFGVGSAIGAAASVNFNRKVQALIKRTKVSVTPASVKVPKPAMPQAATSGSRSSRCRLLSPLPAKVFLDGVAFDLALRQEPDKRWALEARSLAPKTVHVLVCLTDESDLRLEVFKGGMKVDHTPFSQRLFWQLCQEGRAEMI